MNSEQESADAGQLRQSPPVKPLKSAPVLFRINGCGVGMYGSRDADPANQTSVKTRCISLAFIPIVAIDAFRVVDAPGGGWYFLEREKISGFARVWRLCVVVSAGVLLSSWGWNIHTNSDGYRSGKAREKAGLLLADGRAMEAADVYRDILKENVGDASEWKKAMSAILRGEISSTDAKRVAAAVRYADEWKNWRGTDDALITDMADVALQAAGKFQNPAEVALVLSAFNPEPADVVRVRQVLKKALEDLHEADPKDRDKCVELALLREEFGESDGAIALLQPIAADLGEGEGARLYGHLLLVDGQPSEALPYLERYVSGRLADWKQAEAGARQTYEKAREASLDRLNKSREFNRRYEVAGEDERAQMVEDAITEDVRNDKAYLNAMERYQKVSQVVPAIMELGIARLRVAQEETEPDIRMSRLKKAEEAFLLLSGVEGESDEYRLFLGQVYFWSGREPEGRKLFDRLLEAKQRDAATLYSLAAVFRDLGEDDEARKLLEEGFSKVSEPEYKNSIVHLRSLLARTTDERIQWLEKGDASDGSIAVELASARGAKAEDAGDPKGAAEHYREALAGYAREVRSGTSLNNSALLHHTLYRLEGKPEDFESYARLLAESIDLSPAESIAKYNAAHALIDSAVVRLVGDWIDPKIVQFDCDIDLLKFLYQDQAGKEKITGLLALDPNFRKGVGYLWDSLLMAPKDIDCYDLGLDIFSFMEDVPALERLAKKVAEQKFDFASQEAEAASRLKKEKDEENRKEVESNRKQADALMDKLADQRSRSMARSFVANVRLNGFGYGMDTGVDSWIGDLKSAMKDVPSRRLGSTLERALEIAALEKLSKEDSECAGIIEANRRLLDESDILRLLFRATGTMGDKVRNHPSVVEARRVTYEIESSFSSIDTLDDWLLLEGMRPEADGELRNKVSSNRKAQLGGDIRRGLTYDRPSSLLERFWMKRFAGDETGAKELIPKMEASGLKLPPLF